MRVEPPAADHVAARRRNGDPPEAREERPREEERGADLACQLRVEVGPREVLRVDADLVRASPLDVCSEIGEELHHRLDVADARDVREPHLLRCEHTRGEDRERAVLVARGAHRPAQGAAALDHEGLHRAGNATGGLQLAHLRVSGRGVRSQECGSGRTARTRGPEHRRKARPRASRRCSPPSGSRAPRPRRAGTHAGSLAPAAPRR